MRMNIRHSVKAAILAVICLAAMQSDGAMAQDSAAERLLAAAECGSLENHYGPFDYTNPTHAAEKLPIVEIAHFNTDVETLRSGQTADMPGWDLHYTLGTFPNHHRALYSMALYALRHKDEKVPPGARFSGDCYFQRAITFRPDDAVVRLIYSIFLSRDGHRSEAIEQLNTALEFDANNAEIHYNLGLLYEKSGQDELALAHARRAYEIGYPLPGLRHILERKGVWNNDD